MPENSNQSKQSNYSMDFNNILGIETGLNVNEFSQITFSFWFKTSALQNSVYIISMPDGVAANGVEATFTNIPSVRYRLTGQTTDTSIDATFTYNDGNWHHIVCTYDGSTQKIYVDGSLSNSGSANNGTLKTNYNKLYIGSFNWVHGLGPDVTLNGVAIFDYELSTDQITYLYNLNNPMAITGAKPIAYYPLGDNSNPTTLPGYPNDAIGGKVFDFDGVSTRTLSISNNAAIESALSNVTEFTFSGWYNWADMTGDSKFVTILRNGSDYRMNVTMYSVGDNMRWAINQGDGFAYANSPNYNTQTTPNLQANQWFHYCGVLKGSESTNDLKLQLYLNGQDVGPLTFLGGSGAYTGVAATSLGALPAANNLFQIGGSLSVFKTPDGMFTNFQMWDKALTSAEVTTLYNSGKVLEGTQPQTANLQFWWKMDGVQDFYDGTNWNVKDYGPSGTNITTSSNMDSSSLVSDNTIRSTTSPYSNYSIKFDGTDYFEVPFTSDLRLTNVDFTISFWTNPSATGRYIMLENYDPTAGWGVFNDNGALEFYNSSGWLITGTTIPNNVWTHIALVGDIGATNLKVYKNGAEDSSNTSSLVTVDATGPLTICAQRNGAGGFDYDGNLSNLSIWSGTALSASEITEIYNAGVPTDLNSFSGTAPTAWWTLDGKKVYYNGSVLVARDAIGTNDATGANLVQENIEGNAPGSDYNGTGDGITITDLKGDMSSSNNNAHSINMADYGDPNGQGVTPANSGRTTSVPG